MDARPTEARTLHGVAEDGDGRPLVGVRVSFDGARAEAQTGADGGFSIEKPPAGGAATAVVVDRLRVWRVPAPSTEGDRLRLVVSPPDGFPVRVLTPGSAPVPTRYGWTALVRGDDGRLSEGPSGEAAGPRFAVSGLAPGAYALVVWAGPFLPAVFEPLRLDGRSCHPLVTIEVFRRGAAVAGRVLDAEGKPRSRAAVSVRPESTALRLPERRTTTRSDSGGRYRVEGLPAGTYAVVVEAEGGPPAEVSVTLSEREERALDVPV